MRVLAVIPGDGSGSSMIFARRQVRSLSELGLEMRVFFLENRMHLWEVICAVRKLRSVIHEFRPDIVHAHYGTVTSFVCACCTRTPLVVTFRGSDLNRHSSVSRVRYVIAFALSQLSAIRATRLIGVSRNVCKRLWFASKRTVVLPSGVDLEAFRPRPRKEARDTLGWKDERPTVVFNGGYDPIAKGLKLVRDSVGKAQQCIGGIRLVVLDGKVPPSDVPLYLNAADCLVLASHQEGSPNIVKEAMACNLPIVSVDVGDVAERLASVDSSAIVPRNAEAMASVLTSILIKPVRSNGREKLARCSEGYVAGELLTIYGEVMREKSRRSCPVTKTEADVPGLNLT